MRGTQTRPDQTLGSAPTQYSGGTITWQLPDTSFSPTTRKPLLLYFSNHRAKEAAAGSLPPALVAIARITPSRAVPPANRLDSRPLVASSLLQATSCKLQATNSCLFPGTVCGGSSNSEAEEAYRYHRLVFFFLGKRKKKGTKREEAHHPSPK